jgi:hypothetical protein
VRGGYRVTVRAEGWNEKQRFGDLGGALDAIEGRGRELEASAHEAPVGGGLIRRIEPVQLVVARLELAGPRWLRAGVDVRGDGSSEAFTGRLSREVVEQRDGESAYDALRRELGVREPAR